MKKCKNCEHYIQKMEVCQFCKYKPKVEFSPISWSDDSAFGNYSIIQDAVKKMMKQQYLDQIDARISELIELKDKIKNDF